MLCWRVCNLLKQSNKYTILTKEIRPIYFSARQSAHPASSSPEATRPCSNIYLWQPSELTAVSYTSSLHSWKLFRKFEKLFRKISIFFSKIRFFQFFSKILFLFESKKNFLEKSKNFFENQKGQVKLTVTSSFFPLFLVVPLQLHGDRRSPAG